MLLIQIKRILKDHDVQYVERFGLILADNLDGTVTNVTGFSLPKLRFYLGY